MFSFKAEIKGGGRIDLDISDEALKQVNTRIRFGTQIQVPSRYTNIGKKIITIQGVCQAGYLWFQVDGEKGVVHFSNKHDEKIILSEGRYVDRPMLSLKDTVIENIKNNSDKIADNLHNDCENKNDYSYKSIYNALIDLKVKKADAPALFEELIQKNKEEALMNKVDYLQLEIQELKKSNELIIKQNQELLSILKDNKKQIRDVSSSSNEKKLSCSSPAMF